MRYIYIALLTDREGDGCFSIYQISWIKIKTIFFKIKDDYVAIDGVPRIFFYDVVANSQRNVFSTDQ